MLSGAGNVTQRGDLAVDAQLQPSHFQNQPLRAEQSRAATQANPTTSNAAMFGDYGQGYGYYAEPNPYLQPLYAPYPDFAEAANLGSAFTSTKETGGVFGSESAKAAAQEPEEHTFTEEEIQKLIPMSEGWRPTSHRAKPVSRGIPTKIFADYPLPDVAIPSGTEFADIISHYPNHLYGEQLLAINEFFTVKEIAGRSPKEGKEKLTPQVLSNRLKVARDMKLEKDEREQEERERAIAYGNFLRKQGGQQEPKK